MADWPLLSAVIFLPALGALILLVTSNDEQTGAKQARAVALWVTSVTFILSLAIWIGFDPTTADFDPVGGVASVAATALSR